MRIKLDPSSLKGNALVRTRNSFPLWWIIDSRSSLIAKEFGPGVGGLFLAFPAIFPAGATLVEKHEKEKKERAGLNGSARGRKAAGIDAAGATLGNLGLFVFALLDKRFLVGHSSWMVLTGSTVIWLAVSLSLWQIRKRI